MPDINIKIRSSNVFKDGVPPDDFEGDAEIETERLKFPWHCEKGIVDNMKLLNKEFNQIRGLNPVKIFITGPPASGKSSYGLELSAYYNIPLIEVQ